MMAVMRWPHCAVALVAGCKTYYGKCNAYRLEVLTKLIAVAAFVEHRLIDHATVRELKAVVHDLRSRSSESASAVLASGKSHL